MTEATPDLYTSEAEIVALFGQSAVDMRIDDDDTGVILEATDEVNLRLQGRYAPADLASSLWVRRAASTIAAHLLSQRRGNPGQYLDAHDRVMAHLDRIMDYKAHVPRLATRHPETPGATNVVVDDLWSQRKLRAEQSASTGQDGPGVQDIDYPWIIEP